MLLCIDIGNTQIALGLYADTTSASVARPPLIRDWRMRTEPRMTADELDVAVRALLGQYAPQVSAIAALSTVPSLQRELRLLLDRRTDLPSVVVGPGVRTGVPLLVDNPREVGADRVVNTLAAHQLCGTACVVVDFGTSTNIDVVSERGEFLGGVLAPGIEISMEALAARAAALRTVELVPPALGDRQEHRGVPAVGRALRLRRAGRRAGAADPRRAGRRPGDGAGHRWAGPAHGARSRRRSPPTSRTSRCSACG